MEEAKEVNSNAGAKVEELDERLIMRLGYLAAGHCSPIQAVIGSITAQEVIKVSRRHWLGGHWQVDIGYQ